jgi:hypothetical protein
MEPMVVLVRAGVPPAVCFKCGGSHGVVPVTKTFRTTPEDSAALEIAQAAGLLVGSLGQAAGLLAAARTLAGTREAKLGIPLCPSCDAKWKGAERLATLASFGPFLIAMVVIAGALIFGTKLFQGTMRYVLGAMLLVALYLVMNTLPAFIKRTRRVPHTCGASAIDAFAVALTRVHPDAAAHCAASAASMARAV